MPQGGDVQGSRSVFGCRGLLTLLAMVSGVSLARAEEPATPQVGVIVGATTDYVYRGVSLRDEKLTPLLYLNASYGSFYANALLIGTYLGEDALGRDIGHIEADATVGFAPTIGIVELNVGLKYTGYPDGRDLIAGTMQHAERDFIEPFVGAKINLGDRASVGGTAYWTPDYYNETGSVTTLEAQAALVLREFHGLQSKLTATVGTVHSERADVASPGHGYLYYNAGIEGQFEKLLFDLRYWNTDVGGVDGFEQRVALSVGVKLR